MGPISDSDANLFKLCLVHAFRASEKGRQNFNEIERAVRITYRETKILVMSQDERNRHCNNESRSAAYSRNTCSWRGFPSASLAHEYWDFIKFNEDDSVDLYNLKGDLGEKPNLA